MSRASGRKNTPRQPIVAAPGTPEGDEQGQSERTAEGKYGGPIPGGAPPHLINRETMRQKTPIAADLPEDRGMMAHGVPAGTHTAHERGDSTRGPNEVVPPVPVYRKMVEPAPAVPVYLVERGAGAKPLKTLATDKFTVPAAGSDPIRIAGRDKTRSRMLMLVETAAGAAGAPPQGIRFDHEVGNLTLGGGALLRAGAVSYLKIEFNDELFAVSTDSSACLLSVIFLYEVPGGG